MRVVPAPVRFDMTENPYVERAGQNSENIDDAYFDDGGDDALFDAYMMLRDAGHSRDDLEPLALLIERLTVYDREDLDRYYQDIVDE